MEDYEKIARDIHKSGKTCSYALYSTFQKDFNLEGEFPLPRSIDGKCGALLTAHKIMDELNLKEYKESFEEDFLNKFGSIKCLELMKQDRRCNDYVGFAANEISKYINEVNK